MEILLHSQHPAALQCDSLPEHGGFCTSSALSSKISPEGEWLPFFGDTILFALPPEMIRWLRQVQEDLYAACGGFLGRQLPPETFHIPLQPITGSARGWPSCLPGNQKRALALLEAARAALPQEIILRSGGVFSMENASVAMGFQPARESDLRVLASLTRLLQILRPRQNLPMLHATLAYYRPGVYDPVETQLIRDTLLKLGRERREWLLRLNELYYATFHSMNHYKVIG